MMRCDLFELEATIVDRDGKPFLDYLFYTDLPAGTLVIMSCTRLFTDYNDRTCVWSGYNERLVVMSSIIGDFNGGRGGIDIIMSDEKGLAHFRQIQGSGFSPGIKSSVSDELQLEFVVGARQRLRDFGKNNCNLSGQMVVEEGGINVVRVCKSISIPMRPELQPLLED